MNTPLTPSDWFAPLLGGIRGGDRRGSNPRPPLEPQSFLLCSDPSYCVAACGINKGNSARHEAESPTLSGCVLASIAAALLPRGGRTQDTTERASIQVMATVRVEMVERIARHAAMERNLPWRFGELRAEAFRAVRGAAPGARGRAASAGLSPEQTERLVKRLMVRAAREAVRDAAEGMEALPPGAAEPTPEQMGAAFAAYSVKEWDGLIAHMDSAHVRALWAFVREHGEGRKAEAVEGRLIEREVALWLQENRRRIVGHVQDPYLAVLSKERAREANRRGEGRGMAERSSERNVARALTKEDKKIGRVLKVSPYEVKTWRKRAERYPFEEYRADHPCQELGEAFINYWSMIRRPYQR
jgi:hypothetical protein